MNRREFFAGLIGASGVTISETAAAPQAPRVYAVPRPMCACGRTMEYVGPNLWPASPTPDGWIGVACSHCHITTQVRGYWPMETR